MTPSNWFTVLPESAPAAQRTTTQLRAFDSRAEVLAWRDGTPWIIGRSLKPLTVARRAGATAALIGTHNATEADVSRAIEHPRAEALMDFPGSYHAVLARDGQLWVSGDVTGLRPLFTAQAFGVVMVADHARTLAEAAGVPHVDSEYLALFLLGPVPPLALTESGTSPYLGVRAVPPGSAVHVENGNVHVERWWTPPADERPLAEAAPVLRETMRRAIRVRVEAGEPLAVELSGGADSAALSALAYEHIGGELVNLSRAPADPGNDDLDWARRMVVAQPGSRHEVVQPGTIPAQFAGLDAPFFLDAPTPAALSPLRSAYWWELAAGTGARVLLSGKGGDEMTLTPLSYLAQARRRDRATARRHVKGWAALWGLPRTHIAAQAETGGTYGQWLANCLVSSRDHCGWEAGPYVPPWLTDGSRDLLADLVHRAAVDAKPVHERPHQHTAVAAIRGLAQWSRLQADAAAGFGIEMAYPYMDRHVIEAALSTRAEDRVSPFTNKPLLAAAMTGIVPATNLARRTKGGYSADTKGATTAARRQLAALLGDGSQLTALGLADPGRLRTAVTGWERADSRTDLLLHLAVMCEVWALTANDLPIPTRKESL